MTKDDLMAALAKVPGNPEVHIGIDGVYFPDASSVQIVDRFHDPSQTIYIGSRSVTLIPDKMGQVSRVLHDDFDHDPLLRLDNTVK